ncbi:endolytic transglycosylase MltG [Candidatus Gracilibacteria bacterium]|nr:endolytic transglycosylase MltG [Candidatus Gracilibacteria bacterium]MCF7819482.1 endolytic transglycosylase MltG [Candidatus Gracilibacteria bacterium]
MKKVLLLLGAMLVLYFSARIGLVWNAPNSESEARVSVTIPSGSTLSEIAHLLEDREVIQDAFAFRLFSRWKGLDRSFQAGDFVIQRNLTFSEVADILQHGKSKEIKITIPEGFTIQQIDDLLAKKSLIQPGEFTECANFCDFSFSVPSLEGYLFPSTYFVNPQNFSVRRFISRLYNTFQQQIVSLQQDISESGRTLNQIVIMASMIEREAITDEEMPIISGILWKRLDEGMQLGVDATTRYELNDWKRALITADFQKDSPYNTRRKYGLPPTAISNPSLPAVKAALFPKETQYYYYLHDMSGQIRYARTLDEHVANKQQYLY